MNLADGSGFATRYEVILLVARVSFVAAMGFFSMRWIMNQLDPTTQAKKQAKKKVFLTFKYFIDRNDENLKHSKFEAFVVSRNLT